MEKEKKTHSPKILKIKISCSPPLSTLPGFGFSEAPKERGWGITAMASCFHALMTDVLKYNRYCVQGGDW